MSGAFSPADRAGAQTARGRIVRALHTFGYPRWLGQDVLHATAFDTSPRAPDFISSADLARHLEYLEQAGYVEEQLTNDPLAPAKSFWRLTRKGVDLYEGVIAADPGVLIPR